MKHITSKKDNFKEIKDLRKMLNETKRLTLEGFIMPDEYEDERILPDEEEMAMKNDGIGDIEKELIQIRKIALNVINRLADQTGSESYDTMKRIWALVDKAIESKNEEMKNIQK